MRPRLVPPGQLPIETAIEAYSTALRVLTSAAPDELSSILPDLFVTRDRLAEAIGAPQLSKLDLMQIVELDQQLKASATRLDAGVGREALLSWRESRQPPPGAWWWSLDERAAIEETRTNPFLQSLALLLVIVAFGLALDISLRFLSNGADFIGIFGSLLQVMMVLALGSSLTQAGSQWVERVLSAVGLSRRYHDEAMTGLILTLVLALTGLKAGLPTIARHYYDQAIELQRVGRTTSAIDAYRRAIGLDSDFAQAHYGLATAYEDVLSFDQALGEYQRTLLADTGFYFAYNNLARLYIVKDDDFASALRVLNGGLRLRPREPVVLYSLYKNRGWAHLGLELYGQAEDDLKLALAQRADGAAAHCLLAQVLEDRVRSSDARVEWEACLRYERADQVEATWLSQARERLRQEEK